MAFIHLAIILFAILLGIYTGLLGWKRFKFRSGRGPASEFPWKKHIRFGKIFYLLLWIGLLAGFGIFVYQHERIFTSGWHAYLAVFIILLFSAGVVLGWKLSKGKGSNRLALAHMIINYGTFIFVLVQIVLGILLFTLFLAS